jgi:hypothetical protein
MGQLLTWIWAARGIPRSHALVRNTYKLVRASQIPEIQHRRVPKFLKIYTVVLSQTGLAGKWQ